MRFFIEKGVFLVRKQNFYKTTIRLDKSTYNKLSQIAENRKEPLVNIIREMINKGLATEWVDENVDLISQVVRKQVDVSMKTHVERLASLSSKSGHMAATAAFLNVQALMDLVPKENRKNVREMYENARKMAAEYMRKKTKDWEGLEDE